MHAASATSMLLTPLTLPTRLLVVPKILLYYVHMLAYPDRMSIWQTWTVTSPTAENFYAPLTLCTLLAIVVFILVRAAYRGSRVEFSTLLIFSTLFALSLGGHLQIIQLDMTVADRWFYTPFIGLLGMIGYFVTYAVRTYHITRVEWGVLMLVLTGLLAGFALRTIARAGDWQDQETLFGHDLRIDPTNTNLIYGYGYGLILSGRFAEAEAYFKRLASLAPTESMPYNNLSYVYLREGDIDGALRAYRDAHERGETLDQYEIVAPGSLYLSQENIPATVHALAIAVKKYPSEPALWYFLALGYEDVGQKGDALVAAQKSYALNPTKAAAILYQAFFAKYSNSIH
jgi:hypothetical protein